MFIKVKSSMWLTHKAVDKAYRGNTYLYYRNRKPYQYKAIPLPHTKKHRYGI